MRARFSTASSACGHGLAPTPATICVTRIRSPVPESLTLGAFKREVGAVSAPCPQGSPPVRFRRQGRYHTHSPCPRPSQGRPRLRAYGRRHVLSRPVAIRPARLDSHIVVP